MLQKLIKNNHFLFQLGKSSTNTFEYSLSLLSILIKTKIKVTIPIFRALIFKKIFVLK